MQPVLRCCRRLSGYAGPGAGAGEAREGPVDICIANAYTTDDLLNQKAHTKPSLADSDADCHALAA